jgi:hypothetical protein
VHSAAPGQDETGHVLDHDQRILYNPLELYRLIKQAVLKQAKDQYPFAAVQEQSFAMLNTKHGGLSNTQWYEHFNTCHDIAHYIGVELGHKVLWEYCTQSKHSMRYSALGTIDQAARYLPYILLINSGGQHNHLRKELRNNFAKGSNK